VRIEINAGGLGNFFDGVSRFAGATGVSNSQLLISNLQQAKNKTSSLTRGVGSLGPALVSLDNRIRVEEKRVSDALVVTQRAARFEETAITADSRVAAMIKNEWEAFYRANEWLRPKPLPGTAARFANNTRRFMVISEFFNNVWNGIVDWYQNTPWARWAASAIVLAGLVALVIITKGAALPLLAKAAKAKKLATTAVLPIIKEHAIGFSSSTLLGGTVGGFYGGFGSLAENGSFRDGFRAGFVSGMIAGGSVYVGLQLKPVSLFGRSVNVRGGIVSFGAGFGGEALRQLMRGEDFNPRRMIQSGALNLAGFGIGSVLRNTFPINNTSSILSGGARIVGGDILGVMLFTPIAGVSFTFDQIWSHRRRKRFNP
jgi:hypothetical protein